jgi:predicted DNA-binding transcriptional regulator AlpA
VAQPAVVDVDLFEPGALSTPAAAAYVGLSPATLETLRTRGGGPAFMKLGRRVVYTRKDLDHWLADRRRSSTSDVP